MIDRHYLTPLFEPKSVAIVGATEREGSIGAVLVRNMLSARYCGKLFTVNSRHEQVFNIPCYANVEDIPLRVDLAVVATPAASVPAVIDACGRAGVRAAVVISAGFSEAGPRGAQLERVVVDTARRHRIRLIGPNCLGVMRPDIGLDATFAPSGAIAGSIGLISQSGALCSAILDWAKPNNVGFSSVISLGSSSDVDFGEILDYLVNDARTHSIFLYIEGIKHARHFMSALRAASRIKPVLLIKVGRHPAGWRAVLSHTGLMVGDDDVFDAALQRAGVVRLYNIGQLFAASQALFSHFRAQGDRLAIITNGGGPGVMAADRAADLNIPLATLAPATLEKLNAILPATWSHCNPLDIVGDAGPQRYGETTEAVLNDETVDGAVVILTPQAMTDPLEAAKRIIDAAKASTKPVVTCWMGEERVREARQLFKDASVPTFRTPEAGVEMFSNIAAFHNNQKLLMQTPAPLSDLSPPSVDNARLMIEAALAEHRFVLTEMESKALLAAFRIPISSTVVARSSTEAMVLAEEIGLPVAMKVDSPQIVHKSDSGGVRLNLANLQSVRAAYPDIIEQVRKHHPDAAINGVAIEPMILKPNGRELLVGVIRDEVFGPAITFGEGGARVEAQKDRVVALPPLNGVLIAEMFRSERVARMLGTFRNMPPVNMEALELVLLRVSEMVCELPWIRRMEINPLIVDEEGAVAVDVRTEIEVLPPTMQRYGHMAVHPYPSHLVQAWALPDGTQVLIRPLRPEDAEMEKAFVRDLSPETKYFRFMNTLRELTQSMVVRLTQIDYDREMAFIATVNKDGKEIETGVARYTTNPDGETCEFAVVVGDAWQHRGIGRKLMSVLIETARMRGLSYMFGEFLANNDRMLKFVAGLGFVLSKSTEDPTIVQGVLALQAP